jgi:polysaccharide pyruvyl transferase WcaK-like protein
LVDFCNRTIQHNKQVVIYGASMGPWGNNKHAVDYYVKSVSQYSYVICRESLTIAFLESVGIKNAIFQPDPAFLITLQNEKNLSQSKKYIGINLSPLSLREAYGSYSEDMILKFKIVVERIVNELDSEILLIPHVISRDESDNDEIMLRKLHNRLSESLKKRVYIADTSKGFLGIKKQLHECKFIVAARMHCAINAINESVPAIFLSYSQKSQGMADYIYGSKQWILSLKKVESDLIPLMIEMNQQWKSIEGCLDTRICEIRNEYSRLQKEQHLFE